MNTSPEFIGSVNSLSPVSVVGMGVMTPPTISFSVSLLLISSPITLVKNRVSALPIPATVRTQSPPEPAQLRTTDQFELAPIIRPFYVACFAIIGVIAR